MKIKTFKKNFKKIFKVKFNKNIIFLFKLFLFIIFLHNIFIHLVYQYLLSIYQIFQIQNSNKLNRGRFVLSLLFFLNFIFIK